PQRPLLVALTGTDLYRDVRKSARARRSLGWATRLILLQRNGLGELSPPMRKRASVIYQSSRRISSPAPKNFATFDVCVVGHLRCEKDPFRTAHAARLLPASSRVRVLHAGRALGGEFRRRALAEMKRNFRYRWLGEMPRRRALRLIARSRLLVLSSKMEGGANVLSEALAASTPILASRIPGSIGVLGSDYRGFFRPGDTRGLASLLKRVEADPRFYETLRTQCARAAGLVDPRRERSAWKRLLGEIGRNGSGVAKLSGRRA
ncbi:MAG: selenoneine biosynthesis selenosugar synthase SenB, partial [Vicinamibacteria bacterium]